MAAGGEMAADDEMAAALKCVCAEIAASMK
jgi:hypothetical protein